MSKSEPCKQQVEEVYELYKDSLSIYENMLGSGHVGGTDVLVQIANLKNTVVFFLLWRMFMTV